MCLSKPSLLPTPFLGDTGEESTHINDTMNDATPDQKMARQLSQVFEKMVNLSIAKSHPNLKSKSQSESKSKSKIKPNPKLNPVDQKAIEEKVANWDGQPPIITMTFLGSPRLQLSRIPSLEEMIGDWTLTPSQDSSASIQSIVYDVLVTPVASVENVPAIKDQSVTTTRQKGVISDISEKSVSVPPTVKPTPTATEPRSPLVANPVLGSAASILSNETVSSSPESFSDDPIFIDVSGRRHRIPRVPSGPARRLFYSPPSEPVPTVTKDYTFDNPRPAPLLPAAPMAETLKSRPIKTVAYYRIKYANNFF